MLFIFGKNLLISFHAWNIIACIQEDGAAPMEIEAAAPLQCTASEDNAAEPLLPQPALILPEQAFARPTRPMPTSTNVVSAWGNSSAQRVLSCRTNQEPGEIKMPAKHLILPVSFLNHTFFQP